MDKKIQLDKLDLFPSKSEIPLRMSSFKCHTPKNNFLSKSHFKPYISNKYYFNGNKRFLKNKRKDKNSIRCEMPDTPHNTGQYLSHIHQEFDPKKKSSEKNNIDELGCNEIISCFEEDNEDDIDDLCNFNFDFEFMKDKKRERLMSMEGKDLHNFLFKPNESGESADNTNNLVKSELPLQEAKEEHDLELHNNKSSNI